MCVCIFSLVYDAVSLFALGFYCALCALKKKKRNEKELSNDNLRLGPEVGERAVMKRSGPVECRSCTTAGGGGRKDDAGPRETDVNKRPSSAFVEITTNYF